MLKRGDLKGALAETDAALREFSAPNTDWHWRFRGLKGEILFREGLNDECLALLAPELPPSLSTSDTAVWWKLSQGSAQTYLGKFVQAGQLLADAESIAEKYQKILLGEVALRKGTLADMRSDREAAKSAYHQALNLARDQKDSFLEAAALGNLGLVATEEEHYDESIDWNRAALQLSNSIGALNVTSIIMGNMGWSYFEMGDYENARGLYEEAEKSAGESGSLSAQVEWRNNIGNVFFEGRQFDNARNAYLNALELANRIKDEKAVIECYENLALLDLQAGDLDSAEKHQNAVAPFVRAHPDHYLDLYSLLIAGRIEEGRAHHKQAAENFETVMRDKSGKTALHWQAQARLAEVYAREGRRVEADRQFLESLATIERARNLVKAEEFRLSFFSSAISFYNDYIDFLTSQGRAGDALQVAELSRARTLAEGLASSPEKLSFPLKDFHPPQIAQRLGTTVLFYWLGEKHSYLWAITPHEVSLFPLPPADEINSLVLSYRRALVGQRDVLATANPAGQKLYELLVAPTKGLVPSGSRVTILPDGRLDDLNFDTLLVAAPELHYWIEDVTITKGNSLLLLAASLHRPPALAKKLLLVGNSVSSTSEFPELPQAASEMEKIEKYFPAHDRVVLSREQATPGAYVQSNPAQFSFIHFVAHGTASRASPLDSAVILSKQGDSYKLYARDIIHRPLRAELVTISACNGSGDRTFSGEGLVGLTWAFLRAGAHGVVAALWEVNDNSTPQFMDKLYAGISKGMAADAALREAKLSFLRSSTPYRKPFYWAPFEIYRGS